MKVLTYANDMILKKSLFSREHCSVISCVGVKIIKLIEVETATGPGPATFRKSRTKSVPGPGDTSERIQEFL